MTTVSRPASTSSTRLGALLVPGAAALLCAAVVVAVLGVMSTRSHHAKPVKRALISQAGFSMTYGRGWAAVPTSRLARVPSKPVAMIHRKGGKGLVTVRRTGSAQMADPRKLATGLRTQLASRFPDFRAVSARVVKIRAGQAFLFTFVRTRSRVVQTIALAAVGGRTFQLEGIVPGDSPQAAREAADILSSFGR